MKKTILSLAVIGLCGLLSTNALALDLTQTGAGGPVSLASTPAFDDFNASTGVIVDGVSGVNQFAIGAYHQQVLNKKSGKAFLMASTSSAMYYLDISGLATGPTVTVSTSAAYTGYTKM